MSGLSLAKCLYGLSVISASSSSSAVASTNTSSTSPYLSQQQEDEGHSHLKPSCFIYMGLSESLSSSFPAMRSPAIGARIGSGIGSVKGSGKRVRSDNSNDVATAAAGGRSWPYVSSVPSPSTPSTATNNLGVLASAVKSAGKSEEIEALSEIGRFLQQVITELVLS